MTSVASSTPPVAPQIPKHFIIHNDKRIDDYYWLNERNTKPVLDYLKAENDYTLAKMRHTEKLQKTLYEEMRSRIKEDDNSVPYKFGNYVYYTRTKENMQYEIYCRRFEDLNGKEQITLDLNNIVKKYDYLTLSAYKISPNEKLLAYTIDTSGAEKHKLIIKEINSGKIIDDQLCNLDGSVEWANDNETLFYIVLDSAQRPYQLWRHKLGDVQSEDVLVYEELDDRFHVGLHRTKSGEYLIMDIASNVTSEVYLLDRNKPYSDWNVVQSREQDVEYYVYHRGNYIYQLTNKDAFNFKLIRTPIDGGPEEEIIPNRETTLIDDVSLFKNHMAVLERVEGNLEIRIYDFNSNIWYNLEMDEEIYSLAFEENYNWDSEFLRFGYGSFRTPYSIYDIDFKTKEKTLRKQEEVLGGYNSENYISQRIWAPTHDGKKVAITLLYNKRVELKGNNPCLLWGYGSYGATYDPWFSSNIFSLIDRGFVYARAHIRGSSFLGRKWYLDGKMKRKTNTFKDFISAGQFLANEGITSPEKMAIYGGSAGGLLIGAVMNMAPDLCKVAIPSVPFVDVINTMLDSSIPLTVIEFEEWGNPLEKEYYDYMKSYSPYDNVAAKEYPHTLVLAGYNDPRVQYWEPAKWTAKLRRMKNGSNDLLLRTIMGAGHFSSSGRFDYLKDVAFYYAFIIDKIGIS
ncbi:MAG: oligopeptidase B [Candidatus Marinimicrobia bacterium]|nr:oligopeptidase B [Candidatus Neomarinimicrobiota bacterium]